MTLAPTASAASPEASPSRVYEEMFRRSLDAIVVLGPDGRYLEQNPAHAALTGYSDEELLATHPSVHFGAETFARMRDALVTTGQFRGEVRTRLKDGRELTLDLAAFTVRGAGGHVARHVAFARDITAARIAQDELMRSQSNLADFVETSAIGLHWVGPDGIILWANKADHEPLGYTREEFVGHHIAEFHADRHVIDDILARLSRNERLRGYPARLLAKDGSIRHVVIESSVLWQDGKFVHTRCFTRDVTEEKRMRDELEATRAQLAASEKLSALGTLVSGVAHEIRTPLTYIANSVALARLQLASQGVAHETTLRHLDAAQEGVDRVNALVKDLRRFTVLRAESETVARLDLVVGEAVALFRATHRGGAELAADLAQVPPTRLSKLEVQQLVLNLLTNAVEAAPQGHVRVATYERDGSLWIEVEDDGPGIPPEVQLRMFDPFYTTKENGTGLGLSIAHRVATGHRGTIACESKPGSGTRFIVELPLA